MKILENISDIMRKAFASKVTEYENFSFGSSLVSLRIIIVAVMIGVFVAAAISFYNRRVLGRFVRALAKRECFDKDSAKTVSELGFDTDKRVLHSLKNGMLSRMIRCIGRDELAEKLLSDTGNAKEAKADEKNMCTLEKIVYKKEKNAELCGEYENDFSFDRFYLPREKSNSLEKLFEKEESGVVSLILTAVLCVFIAAVLIIAIPWFLSLIDSML